MVWGTTNGCVAPSDACAWCARHHPRLPPPSVTPAVPLQWLPRYHTPHPLPSHSTPFVCSTTHLNLIVPVVVMHHEAVPHSQAAVGAQGPLQHGLGVVDVEKVAGHGLQLDKVALWQGHTGEGHRLALGQQHVAHHLFILGVWGVRRQHCGR